jgi:hypothetical protein
MATAKAVDEKDMLPNGHEGLCCSSYVNPTQTKTKNQTQSMMKALGIV